MNSVVPLPYDNDTNPLFAYFRVRIGRPDNFDNATIKVKYHLPMTTAGHRAMSDEIPNIKTMWLRVNPSQMFFTFDEGLSNTTRWLYDRVFDRHRDSLLKGYYVVIDSIIFVNNRGGDVTAEVDYLANKTRALSALESVSKAVINSIFDEP